MSGQFQERQIEPEFRAAYAAAAIAKGLIVKLDTSSPVEGEVNKSSAATDKHYGVVANAEIAAANYGDVQVRGVAPVLAGGSIAVGDEITSDGNAAGIATTTQGNRTIGRALTAASATEFFDCELNPGVVP